MRALVTGGAGFIGSHLVDRLLADGHRVDVVDDLSSGSMRNLTNASNHGSAFSFRQLDIRDSELVRYVAELQPEVIFHLAAQASVAVSVADPLHDADVNVVGSLRVLDAARAAGSRKVVFAASGGTLYGEVVEADLPVDEDHAHHPMSPYGLSKRTVIDYLYAYNAMCGLDFVALALANIYGPRQDPFGEAGVIAIFAERVVNGQAVTIDGDGEQTRDFVYVADVVDGFVRAADRGSAVVLNIGTGQQLSVRALYGAILSVVGAESSASHGPGRVGDVRHSALNGARAEAVLGWHPRWDIEKGLAATIASFEPQ